MNHKAMFWEHEHDKIRCKLCPQYCLIGEGKLGLCHTRKNIGNELYAINYNEVTSIALDPIEKKPLYHFKPGFNILSLGTFGCNMKCSFCQNHTISQKQADSRVVELEEIKHYIETLKNNVGISFTYNEPFMWYEYIYDLAKRLKSEYEEIYVILVTNGYINEEPLKKILPLIDAMNIDLKAFNNTYYRRICGANLEPVLKTIEIAERECHVEVTTLMVTGENDSIEEIEEISKFLGEINPNIVLHLSRYFPNYKMKHAPTEIEKMVLAEQVAKKYLNYVYVGNVQNFDDNTYCPHCDHLLIERKMYRIKTHLIDSFCPKCKERIEIVI